MEEWANIIGNVGFPVFITLYLLFRSEKLTVKMLESLEELKQLFRK